VAPGTPGARFGTTKLIQARKTGFRGSSFIGNPILRARNLNVQVHKQQLLIKLVGFLMAWRKKTVSWQNGA
jgi:hypothetical protein